MKIIIIALMILSAQATIVYAKDKGKDQLQYGGAMAKANICHINPGLCKPHQSMKLKGRHRVGKNETNICHLFPDLCRIYQPAVMPHDKLNGSRPSKTAHRPCPLFGPPCPSPKPSNLGHSNVI